MEKQFYYRDKEIISKDDLELMRKVWGNTPYNWVTEHVIDENSGSGLHLVTELMLVIQTTEKLYNRCEALKERIAKGLTISRGYYGGYVEENILHKLIIDAIYELEATTDEKVDYHIYPEKEFKRLFNIPYESVMVKVREHEKKIGVIPEPEKKIKYLKESESVCDQCSCYQLNYIKVDNYPYSLAWKNEDKEIYKMFPFLGKLYYCYSDKYIQVYLYDYHNSTKGLEAVLCELEKRGVVFTKKI